MWKGLTVHRPRFLNLPGTGARFHAAMLARALTPLLARIRDEFAFDLIAAEYFFPEGPAAIALGRRFGVPVAITARGSDIHRWTRTAVGAQILAAGRAADAMVAVSEAMRDDMVALGMPAARIEPVMTGIDLERFAPRDRAAAKAALGVSGPLVVALGALIALKGHDLLIDAAPRPSFPESACGSPAKAPSARGSPSGSRGSALARASACSARCRTMRCPSCSPRPTRWRSRRGPKAWPMPGQRRWRAARRW